MQRLLLLTLLALATACGGAAANSSPTASDTPAGTLPTGIETRLSTVAFLGTLHEVHDRIGYPLETVEHVIRAFEPDLVLVELPPDAFDDALAQADAYAETGTEITERWLHDKPELYEVVLPLRHDLGYEVLPVSGWTQAAEAARDAYYFVNPHGPMERHYVIANAAFHATFLENTGFSNPTWLHGTEYLRLLTDASRWLSYYAEEQMGLGGELHVQSRHAALIEDAVRAFPGRRILVVFDTTARWYIEPVLAGIEGAQLVPTTRFLPAETE